MSKFLSAPTVLGLVPGRSRSICSAASISAFPLACVSRVSTASLLRFSIHTCPRYAGSDSCLFDLANSLASGRKIRPQPQVTEQDIGRVLQHSGRHGAELL